VQALGEEVERFARVPAIGLGKPDKAINEDPPRADLGGLRKKRAIGSLQFLLETDGFDVRTFQCEKCDHTVKFAVTI
jgi:hypothetical protein